MNEHDSLAAQVRMLRQRLIDAGFTHGRSPGELVRVDDFGKQVFVRTGYTRGAYRVLAFGRRRGARHGQCFADVTTAWSPEQVESLTASLETASPLIWPPDSRMTRCQTGWEDGQP